MCVFVYVYCCFIIGIDSKLYCVTLPMKIQKEEKGWVLYQQQFSAERKMCKDHNSVKVRHLWDLRDDRKDQTL